VRSPVAEVVAVRALRSDADGGRLTAAQLTDSGPGRPGRDSAGRGLLRRRGSRHVIHSLGVLLWIHRRVGGRGAARAPSQAQRAWVVFGCGSQLVEAVSARMPTAPSRQPDGLLLYRGKAAGPENTQLMAQRVGAKRY
jgi:hypothetical protein